MKGGLTNFMDRKPRDYFPPRLPQSKAFTELKKVCGAPYTPVRNRKWTQLFMADKLAMLLVLRKQADDVKKSRASIHATMQINELKCAFAELKRVSPPLLRHLPGGGAAPGEREAQHAFAKLSKFW